MLICHREPLAQERTEAVSTLLSQQKGCPACSARASAWPSTATLRIQAGEGSSPGLCSVNFCFKGSGSDRSSVQCHAILLGDLLRSPKSYCIEKRHMRPMTRKPACLSLRAARTSLCFRRRNLNWWAEECIDPQQETSTWDPRERSHFRCLHLITPVSRELIFSSRGD